MAQVSSLNPYTIGVNTIYAMISRWYCALLTNEQDADSDSFSVFFYLGKYI